MDIEELQKFSIFIYSVGVILFWLREKNCYVVGLGFLVSSLVAKIYYESLDELPNKTIMARYLVSGLFIATMSFIYYLYYKNETYIHDNIQSGGDLRDTQNGIVYMLLIILIVEILYFTQANKSDNGILLYSILEYILILRLILIAIKIYSRVKYNVSSNN